MLNIENVQVAGFEPAIRGMRNPMNSWAKSDSLFCDDVNGCDTCPYFEESECPGVQYANNHSNVAGEIGPNDHKLMMSLAKGGPVHAKYRRMITVYLDITAPLYWWKEFDTYKVGTVANSCSTMHKIHAKEFTLEDFSCEHLFELGKNAGFEDVPTYDSEQWDAKLILEMIVKSLNYYRRKYLEAKTKPMKDESKRAEVMKKYWWQMIQLLPSSYNQKRTVMLNYEVLHNIYHSRRHHKLAEWHVVCDWIEQLPYAEIITGPYIIGSVGEEVK